MLKLIITKFWPVLIPFILYIIWKYIILTKIKNHHKYNIVSFLLILSILLSLIGSILWFFNKETQVKTRYYVPAKIIDGKIKPAIIK
jgi:hypothetical protein